MLTVIEDLNLFILRKAIKLWSGFDLEVQEDLLVFSSWQLEDNRYELQNVIQKRTMELVDQKANDLLVNIQPSVPVNMYTVKRIGLIIGVRTCNTHQWRKTKPENKEVNIIDPYPNKSYKL